MSGSIGSGFGSVAGVQGEIQNSNILLAAIQQALVGGILIVQTPTSYAVADLPATAASGQFAWASNGRKAAEGPGAGTGVPVYWNPSTSQWFTYYDNTQVQA